ncbi:MAG: hypothetical protein LBO21_03945, partial [Synergistaceae bacterium]|nr:hypothetical protein [Synergistaceae bacterium]
MAKKGRKPEEIQADETIGGRPETPKVSRLLPLKNDLVFKMVFGDHRYIAIIRAFLIAALDIPAEEYEDMEIIDPHLER